VLYLWATAPKLLEAIEVMKAWNFSYKTHAIWDKEKIGMGYWFRGQHELLLVGTKGHFSPPAASLRIPSVIREARNSQQETRCGQGAHSQVLSKPQETRAFCKIEISWF